MGGGEVKDIPKIIQIVIGLQGQEYALLSDGRMLVRTRKYKGDQDNWYDITGKLPEVRE